MKKKRAEPKLHACWWCKSKTVATMETIGPRGEYGHCVLCDGECGMLGPVKVSPAEAIKTWNAGPYAPTRRLKNQSN